MGQLRSTWAATVGLALAAVLTVSALPKDDKTAKDKDEARRPKITLRAQPMISMSPSRVVLTAELTGGANDFEEYYCPAVEWVWGDGTSSEASADCDPYEPGKSEIKRRFTTEHVFRAGSYRVVFRLKRRDKQVASATATIQVRPGLRDIS